MSRRWPTTTRSWPSWASARWPIFTCATPARGAAPDFGAFARYRKLFGGPLIANHGFSRETGNAIAGAGIADAVSFGELFIANPDLVSRFALGGELASSDRSTHYRGGPRGYTDYPGVGAVRDLVLSGAALVPAHPLLAVINASASASAAGPDPRHWPRAPGRSR